MLINFISDELNNQPMGYIRCYAYFLNFAELTLFHIMADDKKKVSCISWATGE